MNLTIGIVLSNSPTYSETFFRSKINGLKASGFHVTLFVQNPDPNFTLSDVVVATQVYKHNAVLRFLKLIFVLLGFFFRFPRRFFKFIRLERRAQRSWVQIIKNIYINFHLLKSDMDWLHFGFATIAVQSENVAQAIDAKMAVSFRGFDLDVYPEQHPNCYELLWKRVDKVHSISEYLLYKAYQLGLAPETPFKIITPAIDVSHFRNDNYKFSNDKIKIITVARLHQIKDLKSTIEAMAILKSHHIDFEYKVVGDGPEHDALLTQIERLELNDQVSLIGKVDHKDVVELLKKTDIYVQYSASEGFCNAVLEAQSIGLLCVVSNGGALPENILHKTTGWVVPKKNPELLVQAIMNIILLPYDEKAKISGAAQDRVKNEFNLNKQQVLFKAFYENA